MSFYCMMRTHLVSCTIIIWHELPTFIIWNLLRFLGFIVKIKYTTYSIVEFTAIHVRLIIVYVLSLFQVFIYSKKACRLHSHAWNNLLTLIIASKYKHFAADYVFVTFFCKIYL